MRKRTAELLILLIVAMAAGCKTAPPKWVERGGWAFPADRGKALYAVGIGTDPDPRLRLSMAKADARAELARTMQTHVSELIKDAMHKRQDHFNSDFAGSAQFYTQVGKLKTDVLVGGSTVFDTWLDKHGVKGQKGAEYVMMIIVLDDRFFKAVQQHTEQQIRSHKDKLLKADLETAIREVEEELEKARRAAKPAPQE